MRTVLTLALCCLIVTGCKKEVEATDAGSEAVSANVELSAEDKAKINEVDGYRLSVRSRIEQIPDASFTPAGLPANYRPLIEASTLEIDGNLPFDRQVERHAEILNSLSVAIKQVLANKEAAIRSGSLPDYRSAEENEKILNRYLLPYSVAHGKAQVLIEQGYIARSMQGSVCNSGGVCSEVDPITLLFFLLAEKFGQELSKDQPFGPNNDFNKVLKFLQRPLGGPSSDLVRIRDMVLAYDTRGDFAKWSKDPVAGTVQFVQDARDRFIPPDSDLGRSDFGKVASNPVVCVVNFGDC